MSSERQARGASTYELAGLAKLLAPSVGEEKAIEAVRDAARTLGIRGERPLTMDEALEVLEAIARTPGILGVTARFAKSRVHLAKA